jgi:hypothetical protein
MIDLRKHHEADTNPVDPAEQKRRDKEFADYERSMAKRRAKPPAPWFDEFGRPWTKPSDIFFKEGYDEMPIRRRKRISTPKTESNKWPSKS